MQKEFYLVQSMVSLLHLMTLKLEFLKRRLVTKKASKLH